MIIWSRGRAEVYVHILITKYLTRIRKNMELFKLLKFKKTFEITHST